MIISSFLVYSLASQKQVRFKTKRCAWKYLSSSAEDIPLEWLRLSDHLEKHLEIIAENIIAYIYYSGIIRHGLLMSGSEADH